MIAQEEKTQCINSPEQIPVPPSIDCEVDVPFNGAHTSYPETPPSNLGKTDSLDDQITKFKYLTGKTVLFISMGAMGLAVIVSILLSVWGIDNPLVENAFEVFKLIAMTVLGYIFGSKSK